MRGDNDIFIVGDAQQRIYGHTAVLSKCGIRIQGRARKLRIKYRTTEQIRSAADSIFRSSGADVADSVFAAVRGIGDASPATTFDDLDGRGSPTGDSRIVDERSCSRKRGGLHPSQMRWMPLGNGFMVVRHGGKYGR